MRSYLYYHLNTVPMMESRKTRWMGHAARTEKKGADKVLVAKPEGKRLL